MRKIRIILEPRNANDSPGLLKNISESFPQDNLEIEFKDNRLELAGNRDEVLEIKIHDDAKQALDKNDEKNIGKQRKIIDKEVAKKENINWIKLIREEGIKVVLKEIYIASYETIKDTLSQTGIT